MVVYIFLWLLTFERLKLVDAGRYGPVSADWVPKVLGCMQQVAGDTASARKYHPKEFFIT